MMKIDVEANRIMLTKQYVDLVAEVRKNPALAFAVRSSELAIPMRVEFTLLAMQMFADKQHPCEFGSDIGSIIASLVVEIRAALGDEGDHIVDHIKAAIDNGLRQDPSKGIMLVHEGDGVILKDVGDA